MNEQQKELIVTEAKIYWKEIIIFILVIGLLTCYWRWNETKKDLAEAVRISTVGRTLDEINSMLDGVNQREKEVYPKMDATIDSLNSSIKSLQETITKLNKPKKEQIYANFKKQNIQDLSKWFSDNGYPNTISNSQ